MSQWTHFIANGTTDATQPYTISYPCISCAPTFLMFKICASFVPAPWYRATFIVQGFVIILICCVMFINMDRQIWTGMQSICVCVCADALKGEQIYTVMLRIQPQRSPGSVMSLPWWNQPAMYRWEREYWCCDDMYVAGSDDELNIK